MKLSNKVGTFGEWKKRSKREKSQNNDIIVGLEGQSHGFGVVKI